MDNGLKKALHGGAMEILGEVEVINGSLEVEISPPPNGE